MRDTFAEDVSHPLEFPIASADGKFDFGSVRSTMHRAVRDISYPRNRLSSAAVIAFPRRFARDPSASGRRSSGRSSPRSPRHRLQREPPSSAHSAAYLPPIPFLSRFHFCVVEL